MKSFKQFISESVNIAGDFTGNLYINSQPEQPQQVGEEYVADVMWQGSLYRLELTTKSGIPSKRELGEQLQSDYPGAVVHQIYPALEKNTNIKNTQRYHPSKLEWID
jgi:spore coat polysaccharide biosynthesis protein SpsF (cytidylyltransferase family)